MPLPNLRFEGLAYGTHQVPWDLGILLYRGGASARRDEVAELIAGGKCGKPLEERLPLIEKIHEVVTSKLVRGATQDSITTLLIGLWQFCRWADEAGCSLTHETVLDSYKDWTEELLHRVRIVKDLKNETAYKSARRIGDVIARALGYESKNPGISLLRLTRVRRQKSAKKVLETKAAAQNLADTFEFGHFLADLCTALDEKAISGPLPFEMPLRNGSSVRIAGGSWGALADLSGRTPSKRERAVSARAALPEGVKAIDTRNRSRLVNLRVEAELQIFIAQTGMNLAQAARLPREPYRWQTDGENQDDFKVYKGRRGGEAIFRCFKAYRSHLRSYLAWLDATGLSAVDARLFPFIYLDRIPPLHALPAFKATVTVCVRAGIRRIPSRHLRKTRVNWLLRRSRNPELTAEQMAHTKETLLRDYEEPHYQSAASEILRFHVATDPTISPPGPGICATATRDPAPIQNCPAEAPKPDCVSPEGCLFCIYHRDVMSAAYCWKLASHARLKALELSLYKPPRNGPIHPANRVIDRIRAKLAAIAQSSELRAQWVRDAEDKVRAGRQHPDWEGHIKLMEIIG